MNVDIFMLFLSVALGFGICAILGPVVIKYLKKLKLGQVVREEGVQAHIEKAGTPTMGGILFLLSLLLSFTTISILTSFKTVTANSVFLLFSTVGFGMIGFLDDYLKIVRKNTDGLKPKQKLLGIFLVSLLLTLMLPNHVYIYIPLLNVKLYGGVFLNLLLLFPILYLLSSATVNAVNLTDGIDGLCSSVSTVVSLFFVAFIFYMRLALVEIMYFDMMFAGALLGYLLYNWYPAKVMMGDVGSFAIGGFVLANTLLLNIVWWLPIFGLIYVWETLSVIMQVLYYKKTKKRLFKMSPFHHHLELCGWKETKIVFTFAGVTLLLCAFVLFAQVRVM